jgi:hypothetical protein
VLPAFSVTWSRLTANGFLDIAFVVSSRSPFVKAGFHHRPMSYFLISALQIGRKSGAFQVTPVIFAERQSSAVALAARSGHCFEHWRRVYYGCRCLALWGRADGPVQHQGDEQSDRSALGYCTKVQYPSSEKRENLRELRDLIFERQNLANRLSRAKSNAPVCFMPPRAIAAAWQKIKSSRRDFS